METRLALLLAWSFLFIGCAHVDTSPSEPAFSWSKEGPLTAGLVGLWIAGEGALKPAIAPQDCRWCETGLPEPKLHFRDDAAQRNAAEWSDRLNLGALPAAMAGLQAHLAYKERALNELGPDTAMTLQAVALSGVITHAVKFSVARRRPNIEAMSAAQRDQRGRRTEDNLSFMSGHTSSAFAMVAASASVLELRGRQKAWMAWAVGLPLATTIGLLRVGAHRHYPSDVLAGALTGTALGYAFPRLLHGQQSPRSSSFARRLRLKGGPGSIALAGEF